MSRIVSLFIIIISGIGLNAQEASFNHGAINERLLIETKWRYTYTLHLESNTIIHKADELYDFFLYLRYNYSYQEYLNGNFSDGRWSVNNKTLNYRFKHIEKFEVAQVNKKVLVLEFTQRNSKGTYQYHFMRVSSKEAPFAKPANELPEVLVEALNPKKKERRNWLAFGKKKKKKRKKWENYEPEEKPVYINIELTGGGYYGGIDPVLKDYIYIKSSGRLIKEFHSVNNGLLVTKKDISREELEAFAEFISDQHFFEMERLFDCDSEACQKRKGLKPRPMPLRLSVAYGDKKKVITIAIWGKDNYGIQYVNYPPALDKIIDAIQRMASRLEDPIVRK